MAPSARRATRLPAEIRAAFQVLEDADWDGMKDRELLAMLYRANDLVQDLKDSGFMRLVERGDAWPL